MPNSIEKAHELDILFCTHAPIEKIQKFFQINQDDLTAIFQKMICCSYLFSPDFIYAVDTRYVKNICLFLRGNTTVGYHVAMHLSASIIMSEWISAEKRAMFWHVLKKLSCLANSCSYSSVEENIACARKTFLFHIMPGENSDFIQKTEIGTRKFEGSERILEGIRQDSVSIFETARQNAGQDVSLTLLLYLLQCNAKQCFMHLLEKFTKQVLQCRSQNEWLFTVCRCASAKVAVPVILWMEERNPGIIAKARDPWGNTLLWHTLARDKSEEIQRTLILQGCNPHAINQWGLSWRLVLQNAI